MTRYALYVIPPFTQKVRTLVNRDIKNHPPLLTQIEKVSGDSPYYCSQLFTRMTGSVIIKLNNSDNNFNSPFLTIKLTKSLCTSRSTYWASIMEHPN